MAPDTLGTRDASAAALPAPEPARRALRALRPPLRAPSALPPAPAPCPRPTRPRAGRVAVLLASVAMAAAVTACADDGRDLAAPGPDQTTTTATTPAETTTTAVAMRVTSGSFADGTPIAVENTCAGEDVPPMLTWTGVPMGTAELAVVVRDLDAGGFVHWVVAGIPARAAGVGGEALPQDAVEALNDFGRPGWAGPCPPSGTHHYEFRVYALAQPSGLQAGAPSRQSAEQIEASPATATAVLSGTASGPTA